MPSLLARCYFQAEKALARASAGLWIAAQAVGMGLLDADDLERITVSRLLGYYDDPAYVRSGLFRWEREALERHFPEQGRILVGAAGAGREMMALHKAGYDVDGFDCSAALVEAGRKLLGEAGWTGRFNCVPPSTVPEWEGPYEAAIIGFSGYMYIPGRERRKRLLQGFWRILAPDAPLLVSFQVSPGMSRQMRWAAKGANLIRRLRSVDPVEMGDLFQGGFKHRFDVSQIRGEFAEVGFSLAQFSEYGYGWAVGFKDAVAESVPTSPAGDRASVLAVLEAVVMLGIARICILTMPPRWYVPKAGGSQVEAGADAIDVAKLVRVAVGAAARRVPWTAVCLPQALAGKWMLRRRGVPSVMRLGMAKDGTHYSTHAWLKVGDFPVTGDGEMERYKVLGEFL